jgi:putative DNA primase/helicase
MSTRSNKALEAVDASITQALRYRPPMREVKDVAAPVFPPLEADFGTPTDAHAGGKKGGRVVLACGTDLKPQPIRWLWQHWLALGKLHILAGAPGQGKTTLALAMAATVTIGGHWPDGSRSEAGNILIWSGEDDPADTLLPRLLAAGAKQERCHFIEGTRTEDGETQPFDPARDLQMLLQAIQQIGGIRLLVIDPVVSAVTGDSHKNTEVRRALQPLVNLAAACDCAVLGITHFAKGGQGTDPAQRVVGSVAFTAVARVVMVAAKVKSLEDGEDARILARSKSNIGPDDGGFEYHLEQCEPIPGIQASCIAWGKPVEGSARDLLTDPNEDTGDEVEQDAAGFLRALLAGGPMTAKDIYKDADGAGYSRDQIKRASIRLGVDKRKDGMQGGWLWALLTGNGTRTAPANCYKPDHGTPEGSTKKQKSARFIKALPSAPSVLPSGNSVSDSGAEWEVI